MVKKPITVEVDQNLTISLSKLAKKSGRKKNLLIGAALNDFLSTSLDKQEATIRKYLDSNQD